MRKLFGFLPGGSIDYKRFQIPDKTVGDENVLERMHALRIKLLGRAMEENMEGGQADNEADP